MVGLVKKAVPEPGRRAPVLRTKLFHLRRNR
jgi:hypothetical protein